MILTVYTSGSINKGSNDNRIVWTDLERNAVCKGARPHEVKFFNPDDPVTKLDQVLPMFGRDMYQVKVADFVIVDARERRGLGVGIEILASRIFGTPLIVVAPPNTCYRKDQLFYRGSVVTNYLHPHLATLADAIVDDFENAGAWMVKYKESPSSIKGINELFIAIDAYKTEVLEKDTAMQMIISNLINTK